MWAPVAAEAPIRLHVELPGIEALFGPDVRPAFPHAGRPLNARLSTYLENLAREHRGPRPLALEFQVHARPSGPPEEEAARRDLKAYFEAERKLAELEVRVNRREGWGFFARTFPALVLALVLAGLFYVSGPTLVTGNVGTLVTALGYLVIITIVWVLLWDPVEKLLFDAYLLRARVLAFERLARATVKFVPGGP